ncbi:MAG TPA: hypothetical protein VHB21_07745 [Minicystis sp.]|nr:hypothetical protein [Minicystis sp.]
MISTLVSVLGPLWWMYLVCPLLAAFVYALASKDDPRRMREVERWRKAFGPPVSTLGEAGYRERAEVAPAEPRHEPRQVATLPGSLLRALRGVGLGEVLSHYELVPKLAYLSVVGANAEQSSDFQSVVAKLEEKGPRFEVHPIPILEGQVQPNTGIEFKKDADFAKLFVVEPLGPPAGGPPQPATPAQAKAIRKWLSDPVREALKDMPEVWLRVDGQTMAVTWFGDADTKRLNELVTVADTIFAEHGADGGPSLFGEDDEEDEDGANDAPSKLATKPA